MKTNQLTRMFALLLAGVCIGTGFDTHLGTKPFFRVLPETAQAQTQTVEAEQSQAVETDTQNTTQSTDHATWKYNKKTHCLTIRGNGGTHDEAKTFGEDVKFYPDNDCPPYFSESDSFELTRRKRNAVKEIVIEPGITVINSAAFAFFDNLEKITIPDTVEKIENYVFFECQSLKEITIPNHVTSIGEECFLGCISLKKMKIGKNLMQIGKGNFVQCKSLRQITVNPGNQYFFTKNGCFYEKENGILHFNYQPSSFISIKKGTKKIGAYAFAYQKILQKVTIPSSVTEIGGGAFYQCIRLKKISFAKQSKCKKITTYPIWYFSDTITTAGCFQDCKKLENSLGYNQ